MRKLKTLALSTLAMTAIVALSISVAGACDGAKKADAATASASGCTAKAAAMKTAGASCTSMTAEAAVASGHCTSAAAHGPSDLTMETVRLPSGALAVFYSGQTDATIASLQTKASMNPAEMGCDIAKCMATNEYCKVEVAKTAHGLMMLVTSDKADVLDSYQERYALAMATPASDESGE